ncbi:hypothetical protein ACFPFV_12730 [Salinicoccus siamensis]|uniref:hypothetical protein n=1 Tax=Salinicoccus siamensis TaxID=381830 RepID=UPI00361C4B1D
MRKAAELRHGRLPQLEKELDRLAEALQEESAGENRIIREVVTEDEIGYNRQPMDRYSSLEAC